VIRQTAGWTHSAVDVDRATVDVDRVTVEVATTTVGVDSVTVEMDTTTVGVDKVTVEMDTTTVEVDRVTVEMDTITVDVDRVTVEVATRLLPCLSYYRSSSVLPVNVTVMEGIIKTKLYSAKQLYYIYILQLTVSSHNVFL
jgi:hypothetical protein